MTGKYVYKIGNASELFRDPNGVSFDKNSPILELITRGQNIITPSFLGVYQGIVLPRNANLERVAENYKLALTNIDRFLEGKDVSDRAHPQLICIGHSTGWDQETVRIALEDPLRRIAIYPAESLPDFGRKDSGSVIKRISKEIKRRKIRSKEDAKSEFKKEFEKLVEDRRRYGFTRVEQAFLEMFSM